MDKNQTHVGTLGEVTTINAKKNLASGGGGTGDACAGQSASLWNVKLKRVEKPRCTTVTDWAREQYVADSNSWKKRLNGGELRQSWKENEVGKDVCGKSYAR